MSERMRAVGFDKFGDPSVLHIVTVPKPVAGPGQVLVKVAAATVNPTDLGFRAGARALPPGVEPPYIPGILPADRAAEAHRRLELGGVRGRLVLTF
jgi:NADPH2:quinone reductase